jgi:ABC-type transport system substrate-binding protein
VPRAGHAPRWLLLLMPLLTALALLAGCSSALPPQAVPVAPPPPPPANPAGPDFGKQLTVAVDDLGTGFNPHLTSDISPVSTEVAALVLPSVFRPGTSGQPQLDTTVATSAKVTATAPFTVSYELNLGASWSDNAPIAAEDFVYLWQRMRAEPGVVDAAGYRLITDVRSRAGGKAVDVVFAQSYPAWQRLFNNLLPAHLLKDAPRGFGTALSDSIPVSGGPFQVISLDRARGQLVLARNDHYWVNPPVLDTLVIRRIDPTGLLDGLRTGELPIAHLWPDQPTLAAVTQLGPQVRIQPVAQPMVVQLGMRTDQGVMTDVRVRQAVGALLNRDALIAVGTSNGVGGVRDDAQLLAPSEPGYHSTAPGGAPIHPDAGLATQLLTSAGYQHGPQGRWTLHGAPLRVTVGAPNDRPRFLAIAQEVVKELDAAGVDAQLVTAPGAALFTDPTVVPTPPSLTASASPGPSAGPSPLSGPPIPPGPPGAVRPGHGTHGGPGLPVAVSARPSAAEPAAARPTAAPPVPGRPVATASAPAPGAGPSAGATASSSAPPAAPPAPAGVVVDLTVMPRAVGADLASTAASNYGCPPGMAGVAQPARNSTGFCLSTLQPILDATLGGALSPDQADATIESVLWQQLPVIPLFQAVTTLVTTPKGDQLTGHVGPGALTSGPFVTAPSWQPAN